MQLTFLGQGNANVVFLCGEKLVRIRKKSGHYESTSEICSYIERRIKPILGSFLVSMEKEEFSKEMKASITGFDDVIEWEEPFILKMDNCLIGTMSTIKASKYGKIHILGNGVVLELKPKWLNLGIDHAKCRNCNHYRQKHHETPPFCSLSLLEKSGLVLDKTIRDILRCSEYDLGNIEEIVGAFVAYFMEENVLDILEKAQNIDDNSRSIAKLQSEDDVTDALLLGMTLRDVTVFLRCENGVVCDVKVADVDRKSKRRWKYWKESVDGDGL